MATSYLAMAMRSGNFTHKSLTYSRSKEHKSARCTGKVRLWKGRPGWYEVPVKYGLRESFYITPSNAKDWIPSCHDMAEFDPAWATSDVLALVDAILTNERQVNEARKHLYKGVDTVVPERNFTLAGILADALEEAGCDAERLNECRKGRYSWPCVLGKDSPIIIEILMHKKGRK